MSYRVLAGYLGLVGIWSTTPLAVKWSVTGVGFEFASLVRFGIAVAVFALWQCLRRERIPFGRDAWRTYALAGVNFYTFIAIFWGAQFVPSGWLGLIWGVSPFVTAVLARVVLGEQSLTAMRIGGMVLGACGLALVFDEARLASGEAALGLAVMLVGVGVSSWTSVEIKRVGAAVPAFAVAMVAACLALPAYMLSWLAGGAPIPAAVDPRTAMSLAYVGVFGTSVVFVLLYFVLKHMAATRISLIGMISPVLALILGNVVNDEVVGTRVWLGAATIVAGLALHEYLPRRRGS